MPAQIGRRRKNVLSIELSLSLTLFFSLSLKKRLCRFSAFRKQEQQQQHHFPQR